MSQFPGYMGGAPGDGFTPSFPEPSTSVPAPTPVAPSAESNMAGSTTAAAEVPGPQQVPRQGSITQFAPPPVAAQPAAPPASYAERSAQAHAATGAPIPATVVAPMTAPAPAAPAPSVAGSHSSKLTESPAMQAHQNRILTDATRKVQEHAYYMRQAMDRDDLPTVLDRAARMLGELGDHHHHHHHHHHVHSYPPSRHENGAGASQLTPKNYYELHMRVLDDIPSLEEYLLNLTQQPDHQPTNQDATTRFTMKEIYHAAQYCPRAVSRLYLQICAGSALIRSKEVGTRWILNDLIESVKCVQCPLRGLFLRHFLLQALRDKLPDSPAAPAEAQSESKEGAAGLTESSTAATAEQEKDAESDPGTVKDSYEFVLANFIEMNKLWVRIQHLPGDGKSKEQRKRRERERNELRILVGTNLVRLSQLEGVTSQIYGEVILPKILEQIVACRDPLAQAYLIDCIIQVFPDEYHIETLSILLGVCPKLRDKVNIRTILQSLMDRLANYYADEELLDETDTNEVKKAVALDSFVMFEQCVENVYNARGPHLTSKEVIRLQTALLNFSLKCYPGNMEHVNKCLKVCVESLRQVGSGGDYGTQPEVTAVQGLPADSAKVGKNLDDASVKELEKLLSIPLDSLALKILELDHYSDLLTFLPWKNRRDVAMILVKAIDTAGSTPRDVKQIEQLFSIISPVIRDENMPAPSSSEQSGVDRTAGLLAGLGVDKSTALSFGASFNETDPLRQRELEQENRLVEKLVHLMAADDTDTAFEMLSVARKHLSTGGRQRVGQTLVPVVFSALRLATRVYALEYAVAPDEETETEKKPTATEEEEKEKEVAENLKEETKEETQIEKENGTDDQDGADQVEEGTEKEDIENVQETTEEEEKEKEVAENLKEETKEETQIEKENGTDDQDGADQVEEGTEKEDIEHVQEKTTEAVSTGDKNGELAQSPDVPTSATTAAKPPFTKSITCRKIFVFLQQTVSMLAKGNAEVALKLYLEIAVAADNFADVTQNGELRNPEFGAITYELIAQAFILHEEEISDSKAQQRCIVSMIGTLLACLSIDKDDYESLITKTAQYAAKMLKKPEQCRMVSMCSHLFYRGEDGDSAAYRNPQRVLECLQRALKLADACTMTSPSNVDLFVDLLDHYVYFFEKDIPLIQDKYVSGLIALIKEHLNSFETAGVSDSSSVTVAKAHFNSTLRYLALKKQDPGTKERFAAIECDSNS